MRTKFVLLGSIFLMLCFYGSEIVTATQGSTEQIDIKHNNENVIHVGQQELVQEVVKRNASAVIDYLQAKMSKEQIKAEKGIFEPIFQSSFNGQRIHVPNTTEEMLTRERFFDPSQEIDYFENTAALEVGVSGLIPSGALWNLKFIDNTRNSSTIEKYRNYKYEYDSSLKLSLEQPLLKGFGKEITMAKIDLAKIQSEVDENKFEQKLLQLVGATIQIYWKLYGAQQIYKSWEKSLNIAEDSLKDYEIRALSGKIAKTEFMESQSSIYVRRGELHNAKSKVVEAQNQLMTLLNISVSDNKDIQLIATDNPFGKYDRILGTEEYVKMALEKWPEYKIAEKTVEKERIQVKYAQNQLLPQLNIIGTVSTNSLETEYDKALTKVMDDEFLSWSIGVKISIPFPLNVQAKSGLLIAKMRAKQAEIELDAIRKSLSNSINSKVEELRGLRKQLREYEKGLEIKAQLLEIEQIKLKSGRISLKNLLAQEEEYINYQRKVLSGVVNCKLAEASLEIAAGNILAKYNIDQRKIQYPDVVLPTNLETIFK